MAVAPEDIAVELGRTPPSLFDPQYVQWERWINSALLLLRIGDGDHQGFGDLSGLDPDAVDYVVTQAVVARVLRPDDAVQVDVAVDDGRVSRMYSPNAQRVFIRDEWWNMLADQDGESFSIGPC